MLDEELKDEILSAKVNYLNGYLAALGLINSYFPIGMRCKIYTFNFSTGDIEKCIQNNAYELFGVYPNDYEVEIKKSNDWETKLKYELNASTKRRILLGSIDVINPSDYLENLLVQDLSRQVKFVNDYFVGMIKNEFCKNNIDIFEVTVTNVVSSYRIIGIDLIFEIEPTKILYLQILGND